ncbi:MAG: hypothetical protein SXG53_04110 [Pseudomonadota bacterium]|nr:hypothetical protein [Pseudomonadota bacterium]
MGVDPYSPESNSVDTPPGGHDGPRHPQAFASLFDINRQTIALLIDVSTTAATDRSWSGWRTLGNELAQLDATQRESLARCPFSLIDAGLRDTPRYSRADRVPDPPAQAELPFSTVLLQTRFNHLAQAAYLFAWHLVRSDVITARLVFAMNSASASLMAQVTLTDIREIAQEQVRNGRVRPRWHNRPDAWFRLMHMARSPPRDDFATVTTRGLQLFLQELIGDEHGK